MSDPITKTAVATGALSAAVVALDAAVGTAFWQSPSDHPVVCSEYGCRDCDDLAAAAAAAALDDDLDDDLDALLGLSDDDLAALDAYLDDDQDDDSSVVPFADGIGWDWPGTDWDQPIPF